MDSFSLTQKRVYLLQFDKSTHDLQLSNMLQFGNMICSKSHAKTAMQA